MPPADFPDHGESDKDYLSKYAALHALGPVDHAVACRMATRFTEIGIHVKDLNEKEFIVARACFEGRGMLIIIRKQQTCQCCDRPIFTLAFCPKLVLPFDLLWPAKKKKK